MKFFLTFIVFFLSLTFSFAQSEIAIVDYDKVLQTSPQKFEFDFIINEVDTFIMQFGRTQIGVYNDNMQLMMQRLQGGCASIEDEKRMLKVLQNQEQKIRALEKFHTDTLPIFQQKLTFELHKIIQSEIDKYGDYIGVSFIGDSNKVYFHTSIIEDITYEVSFFLKQRYQDPQYKKERQKIIQSTKERYDLNQNLNERFAYALLKKSR